MSFNNGFESRKFKMKQESLAATYRKAGMTDEAVQAMYDYDKAVFLHNRREAEHAVEPSVMLTTDETTGDSRYMDMDEFPAQAPLVTSVDRYAWIDDLENADLCDAIRAMKPDYIEIITLMMKGYQQNDIAKIMGSTFRAINNKITRIKNILKNLSD